MKYRYKSLFPRHTREHRLPKVIIIGARKAGTRAVLEIINLHSKVKIAHHEIHFFEGQAYENGLEWYKTQLPKTTVDEIGIEKSPKYFVSPQAPKRMKSDLPDDIKLILIVRNPIDRLISGLSKSYFKVPSNFFRFCSNKRKEAFKYLNGKSRNRS